MKRILTVFMSILLVGAMLMSFASCGSSDEVEETEIFSTVAVEYTESATPVAHSSEDVLAYFNNIVNGIKTAQPKVSYRYEMNVPNDSIKITEKGKEDAEDISDKLTALNDSASGIKDMMLENIREVSGEVAMGNDNSEYVFAKGENWTSKLTINDIDYATIKEVGDIYYITIAFDDIEADGDTTALSKVFELRDKDEILASEELAKSNAYLKLNDYSVAYSGCKITAKVDRLTDEIINLNYYKAANVVADMTYDGEISDVSVLFTLEDKSNFDFSWENELPTSPLEATEVAEAE